MILPSNMLRECLDMLATQTDTVTMSPVEGGVRMAAYRQDRIALIDLTIQTTEPIPTPIGVTVSEWSRVLRSISNDVTITYDGGRVTLEGDGYRFVVANVDVAGHDVRIPEVPHTAETMIPVSELRRIGVADTKRNDAMTFSVSSEGTRMSSYDDKGLGVDITIPQDVSISEGEGVSTYSLEAFVSFVRAAPADAVVTVTLAKDYPMTVVFGGRGYDGRWMLAPRIEEE